MAVPESVLNTADLMFVESLVDKPVDSLDHSNSFTNNFKIILQTNSKTIQFKEHQTDPLNEQNEAIAVESDHSDILHSLSGDGDQQNAPLYAELLKLSDFDLKEKPALETTELSDHSYKNFYSALNHETQIQNESPDRTTILPDYGIESFDPTTERRAHSIEEPTHSVSPPEFHPHPPRVYPQSHTYPPYTSQWYPNDYRPVIRPFPYAPPYLPMPNNGNYPVAMPQPNHRYPQASPFTYSSFSGWPSVYPNEPMPLYFNSPFYPPPRHFYGPAPVYPSFHVAKTQPPMQRQPIGQLLLRLPPARIVMSSNESDPQNFKSS